MPGEGDLGDLIVALRLDDADYRARIKATLAESVSATKAANASMGGAMLLTTENIKKIQASLEAEKLAFLASGKAATKHGADVQSAFMRQGEALESVRALQGALFLLTGQHGFLVIEAGRAAAHLGRLTTAAGGLRAAFLAAGLAGRAFLVSIGPIGVVLLGAGAAYMAYKRIMESTTETTKKAAEANKEFTSSFLTVLDQLHAETDNPNDPIVRLNRRLALKEKFPSATEGQINTMIRTQDELVEVKLLNATLDRTQALRLQTSILRGEGTEYDLIGDAAERVARIEKDRAELLKSMAIEFGGRRPSDFMDVNDPRRSLQLFRERAEDLRKAARGEPGTGFSIGTQAASAFRFGPGAMGSVIGQQTEAKKTNELLKEINTTLEDEFRQLERTLGGGTGGSGLRGTEVANLGIL